MSKVFEVGNTIEFSYNGKNRAVKIEKVKMSAGNPFVGPRAVLVTGYDYTVENYRSFKPEAMKELKVR